MSIFCVSAECFRDGSIYSMSEEIWRVPHFWWEKKKSKKKIKKKIQFFRKKKKETTHTSSAGFWFRLCPTLLHLAQTKAFYIYRTLCSRATGSRASAESCASPTAFLPFPSWMRYVRLLRLRSRWLVAIYTAVTIEIKEIFVFSLRQRPNRFSSTATCSFHHRSFHRSQ